jgi:N6-L-threonylcarbamoyladenine synthase
MVKGFRLFDKVRYQKQECFIFGRRSTGRMDVRLLDGTHINASVGYKSLKLLEPRGSYLTERRIV